MEFFARDFSDLTVTQLYEILKSRSEIFMLEQDIRCLDMDDVDYRSRHFFLWEDGRAIAYLRAFYVDDATIKIGRVLSLEHKKGLGTQLMEKTMDHIQKNMICTKICVDAQKQAAGFYEKMGFRTTSGEFLEEGIVHISMEKEI